MTIMQQKRGTAAEWTSNSTIVLAEGEIGVEYDTGKAKVGDGTSAWSALSYIGDGGSSSGGLPAGGTAGEILAKIDGTDYNAEWIENFTPQVKHEVKLAESISKGQAVYVSSANGTNIIVSKASNATEATSSKTLGLLETGGATNAIVKVVTEGLLTGLDTSTATAGDPVWLGTSGNLIYGLSNKPVAPAHLVFIGIVTRVHAVNGEIFIRTQNGFELNEIHDILIGSGYSSTASDKDLLAYESSTSLWKNKSFSTLDLLTATAAATAYQPKDADLTSIAGISTTSGILKKTAANTWSLMTDNSANWDSAYTDRLKWDGGSTGLTPATGRTSLGATTVGSNLFTLANPSAVRFLRLNADNTVSALSDADFRTAIGVGSSSASGTVTSVGMTVPTGLSVSPSSITDAGTFAVTLATNYSIPLTADTAKGISAYGWGDHSLAGYLSTTPAILGGAEDLNTKDAPGLYHQNANVDAASGTNYPVPLAGMLTVSSGEGFIYQTYQTYGTGGSNRLYHRGKYDGSWSTWRNATDAADRYSGSAWTGSNVVMVAASSGAVTAPSLRPDGGALQAGDLWITW